MSDENGHHGERVIEEIRSLALPTGWARIAVGEVGIVRLGRQRSPKNRSADHPTKYIRAANITWTGLDLGDVLDMDFRPEERANYRLQPGDVLLSEASGSASEVGKPAIWNGELENCCFQNTVIRFRPRAVSSKFALIAFLHFARNRIFARVSKGVGIHHLSADRFASMPFLLPPCEEQGRIVAKVEELLSDLDAGVAALQRTKAKLKRYRAAVLKAAVEGRLTAEWREEHKATEPASKLLERILAERRKRWEAEQEAKFVATGKTPPKDWREKYTEPSPPDTSTLPKLPDYWCWASIDQLAECLDHMRVPVNKEEREKRQGAVPYYGANGLVGHIDDFLFDEPLVLIVEDETFVGREKPFAYKIEGKSWVNNHAHILRASPAIDTDFLNYSLMYYPFVPLTTGTTARRKLTKVKLMSVRLPLPPLVEQQQIVAEIQRRLSLLEAAHASIEANLTRSAALRQGILKRAFEGNLVPQDPKDEPANVLLERLRASRSKHEENVDEASPARTRHRRARSIK